ncbi:ABC transporter ATP-binding protein [Candidatus Sumerlaeota bacterium]|nr:ABC transporter ATP-binding protein [Candidatus Sumerlaeota bacterium]
MSTILQTHGLTKHYGRTVGIEGLELGLERGEILGFLGPNGAGKTTTIRLVLGLLRPTAGGFHLFGESIHWGDWRHRARIGFLTGDLRLPRRMTGQGLLRHLARFHARIDWDWIGELVDRLDLDLSRTIRALSRGNLQKLGIIQALMHRPELVILDEPTTALDPLNQREVLEILRGMRGEGTTVFFSSHHIDEVEKICDRVAFVREGRLAGVESIDELRAHRIAMVEVRLSDGSVPPDLSHVEGVVAVETRSGRLALTVQGRPLALLRRLAELPVEEITWQAARLEDHFFAHYRGGR